MTVFAKRAEPVATPIFSTYWKFAAERQAIFYKRVRGKSMPWTEDNILSKHRFTNCYRASDRVSQYLIQNIIYSGPQDLSEIFFRTILFKLFNKIETWQLLQSMHAPIRVEGFDVEQYSHTLDLAFGQNRRIYSAAYIMPAYSKVSGRKHRGHLQLLREMLDSKLPQRIADSRTMLGAYEVMRSVPIMGQFLAYQYIIDLNYSRNLSFTELEFVVAGPGAKSGIEKCFRSTEWSHSDLIKWVVDHQEELSNRYDVQFPKLWGRQLQLVDCQNLFCEVDKYARAVHPDCVDGNRRTRIKQGFSPRQEFQPQWYPPKWKLNRAIRLDLGAPHGSDEVSAGMSQD